MSYYGHAIDEPGNESDDFSMRECLFHTKLVGRIDDFTHLLVVGLSFLDNELLGLRGKTHYGYIDRSNADEAVAYYVHKVIFRD